MTTMQLVEQHIIKRHDPRWSKIDAACFRSKNLYNAANYVVRQEYIFNHRYIAYPQLAKLMRRQSDYCALPRKVSQWVLKQLNHDWQAFFAAHREWRQCPDKACLAGPFNGRPSLPTYKHKSEGRNLLTYTTQAVSRRAVQQKGVIEPSQLGITIESRQKTFDQVRLVPRKTHYVVEIVYSAPVQPADVDPGRVAAIDIGLDNLATVTFNQPEASLAGPLSPLLVNGRPLKAINQFYNKERARLQGQLADGRVSSRRLETLTDKRNRRVNAYLHLSSRRIIDILLAQRIGTLVIGKNDGWKQTINLGRRTNQNFVQIPHARFIQMLTYKAELVGIQVIVTEESYTSKCRRALQARFLDGEPIGKHDSYAGKRVKRWLFVASDGRKRACKARLHADVNRSYNIMRKVIPNVFEAGGIEVSVVTPVRVTPR